MFYQILFSLDILGQNFMEISTVVWKKMVREILEFHANY